VESFDTLPARLERPLRFVEGGDAGDDLRLLRRMNALAGSRDPAFAVLGGDLAYCDGDPGKAWRWEQFLGSISRDLRAPSGRLIPLVVAVGNHEVSRRAAPFFEAAFVRPGKRGRATFDAGDYLSLLLLDTGHLGEVGGAQSAWLRRALAARERVPHVFPVYHVPAYPSVRPFDGGESPAVRSEWVPEFERSGIRLAFEHHDHAFKVTRPLRRGRVDPAGIVYLGDGAWGTAPRKVRTGDEVWYLETAASVNNFHEVTLAPTGCTVRSFGLDGRLLHRMHLPGRTRATGAP
jgi:hypothetical protein